MRSVLVAVLAVVMTVGSVRATVVLPADLGELARDAQLIVRGHVVAVDARWIEGRRGVETVVTLEVERYLKGQSGETVQFRVPGGRLGRYRNIVVGAPEFTIGQRVVIFLGGTGPGLPYTLGLGQGVFRVSATDGAVTVTSPAILPVTGGAVPVVRGDPARRLMPLGEFEQRVRDLAGAAR